MTKSMFCFAQMMRAKLVAQMMRAKLVARDDKEHLLLRSMVRMTLSSERSGKRENARRCDNVAQSKDNRGCSFGSFDCAAHFVLRSAQDDKR